MEPTKPSLAILYPGNCEPLKATFHGVALVLASLMGAYNVAAWMRRRQSHLAVNAAIYIAATFWEQRQVVQHLFPCRPPAPGAGGDLDVPTDDQPTRARAA